MLSNLTTVAGQVLVLFFLVAVGVLCARGNLVSQSAVGSLSNLTMYAAIPCTLINAFQLDLTPETLQAFLVCLASSVGVFAVSFLAAHCLVRDRDSRRKRMLTLAAVIPNCNFMGFPLLTAILGSMGVFYGSAFAAVTPLFTWTVGILYLRGDRERVDWRKVILNPGVFGIAAGLVLFLGGITLPALLEQGVTHLANLAVPVPMVIIGIQLAHTDLGHAVRDSKIWIAGVLRMLVFPLLTLAVLFFLGVRGPVLVATVIAAATPPAVILAMLDDPDSTLGAEVVSLHTLCAVVTMPLVVSLAQTLAAL